MDKLSFASIMKNRFRQKISINTSLHKGYFNMKGGLFCSNNVSPFITLKGVVLMHKRIKKTFITTMALSLVLPFSMNHITTADSAPHGLEVEPLKERYEDSFEIGAAVEPYQLEGTHGEMLKHHYNSITAEKRYEAH